MSKEDQHQALRNLVELKNEILDRLGEMELIIRELADKKNNLIWERAKSYWHTSVMNNLSAESGSFLGSMVNFNDTFKELKDLVEEEQP